MRAALALVLVLAACGGGSSSQPKSEGRYRLPPGFVSTGVDACDEVIRLTYCTWEQRPVAPEQRQAFEDGVTAWRAELENGATHGNVVQQCMTDRGAMIDSAADVGCR